MTQDQHHIYIILKEIEFIGRYRELDGVLHRLIGKCGEYSIFKPCTNGELRWLRHYPQIGDRELLIDEE